MCWPTLPCGQNLQQNYGNEKDVGVSSSALIPTIRLSHCPYLRISNVKPAHVERYIYTPTPDAPEPIYTQTNPLRAIPY